MDELSPRVSFLVPVYNRAHLIKETVESALSQSYPNFEVVVCDNASTDDTWDVLQQFASEPRVRLFRNRKNLGPVRNWRRCLDEAQGEFAKLLFSDDLVYSHFLARTVPLLEDDEIGFVFTAADLGMDRSHVVACGEWKSVPVITSSQRYIRDALIRRSLPVSPGAALFRTASLRRNLLDEIPSPSLSGFWRTGAGTDLLCYLLTAKDYPKVAHLSEPLCFFRDHAGSISVGSDGGLLENYWQARLWFAENHTESVLFAKTRVHAWAAVCRRAGRLLPYGAVLSQFLSDMPRKRLTERLLLLKEGARILKRSLRAKMKSQ